MRARCCFFVTAGVLAAAVAGCAGGSALPAPAPRPDVSGTWVHPDGPGGASLGPAESFPLTPWAAERMAAERPTRSSDFRETTDPAVLYADPNGYPRIQMHPMKFKLVQTEDYVYQLWEYNQNWRQIAMNQEHSPDAAPAWYGHAVGTWDGDTLVVDSTGYKPSTWLNGGGLPHTEDLYIVERIRRDGDTLAMEFTFEDSRRVHETLVGRGDIRACSGRHDDRDDLHDLGRAALSRTLPWRALSDSYSTVTARLPLTTRGTDGGGRAQLAPNLYPSRSSCLRRARRSAANSTSAATCSAQAQYASRSRPYGSFTSSPQPA